MPEAESDFSFITVTFRSVWALELLCFLRSNRQTTFSHPEMVNGLRASNLVVTQGLETLAAAGLVLIEPDGSARYSPASDALERDVTAAVELYVNRPDAVRRAIVSSTNPGLAAFVDAFRLRKD